MKVYLKPSCHVTSPEFHYQWWTVEAIYPDRPDELEFLNTVYPIALRCMAEDGDSCYQGVRREDVTAIHSITVLYLEA